MYNMKPQRGKTPKKPPRRPQTQLEPVEVYGRIRPINEDEPLCVKVISPTTIKLTPPESSNAARNGVVKESVFTFKQVFDETASQKLIFDQMALPCVEDVLKGKNALLFAYGITSSGKTHTMNGIPQDQGILPRSLDVIFNSIEKLQAHKYVFKPDKMNGYDIQPEHLALEERQQRDLIPSFQGRGLKTDNRYNTKEKRVRDFTKIEDIEEDNFYAVFVSYVEIYNNYVYDLLEDLPHDPIIGFKLPTTKLLREDSNHNMYVSGAIEVEVKSMEEAYDILMKGQKRRKVAHTNLNTESSRSHSVFNIRVVQAPVDPLGEQVMQDKEKIVVSQLSLVDLAGSERSKRTNNAGDRLKEAGNINNSLMALRNCIEILRENQKNGANKLVPYRGSRLTHLFKNNFDGEGRVRMIVCINPKAVEYDETICVMAFAELTQEVAVKRPDVTVRFDGLTKGRRKMNEEYRDAIKKAREQGQDPVDIPIPEPMIYNMGDMFPLLTMSAPDQTHIIHTLVSFLEDRQRRREILLDDYKLKQDSFREHLRAMEKENREMTTRLKELTSIVDNAEATAASYQKKNRALEKMNENLTKTASMCEMEKRRLEKQLDDQAYLVHKEKLEKDRLQQDCKARIALTEQQYSHSMQSAKRKVQADADAKVQAQRYKMRQIKNLLGEDDNVSVASSDNMGPTPTPASRRGRSRTTTTSRPIIPATSEPDLSKTPGAPDSSGYGLRGSHHRAMTAYTNTVRQAAVNPPVPTKRPIPPPTKPKPQVSRYAHRRSKSHDVWLDHRPNPHDGALVETVLQPKMGRKKSVTNLTEKDTRKATKYAITAQCIDSEGDLATKITKGDILHTSTGGTQVVFNDVEKLKQRSPGSNKRRSPQLRPEDFDGEWSDTDDRCRIAIEGHGELKKIKMSHV